MGGSELCKINDINDTFAMSMNSLVRIVGINNFVNPKTSSLLSKFELLWLITHFILLVSFNTS